MHSNSVLNSNLLDIVFENRNKDYGAYVLRRDYNKRLLKSLTIALTLATFIFWLILAGKNATKNLTIVPFIPDASTSNLKLIEKIVEPKKRIASQVKSVKAIDYKALIVPTDQVEKVPLVNAQTSTAGNGDNIAPLSETLGADQIGGNETKEPVKLIAPEINRNIVDLSPEVLPQFPGGINELIKFLKRNLNTPQELQEGEEIAVKVKFIVSYTGDLMGFNVMETGGELFDNEVIRVLKKMPKWIPGKASGESVSAYFIIPVKFRVSD